MRAEIIKDGSLAQFGMQIREQKCIEKLLESANITDVDPAKAAKTTSKKKTEKKKAAKIDKKAKETTRKDTSTKRTKKSVGSAKKTVAKKADKKAK